MAKKILIIGDTIVDIDIDLRAIGLSLESPTIKTKLLKQSKSFGGAANVAKYSKLLGAEVTFITCMAADSENEFAKKYNIDVINLDDSVENTKSRFYVLHGDERYKHLQINNTNTEHLNLDIDLDFDVFDCVAISDYRCGFLNDKLIRRTERSLTKTFGASQVSSHQPNFDSYINMDYLVCNERESKFIKKTNNVVITKGQDGCELNGVQYPANSVVNPKKLIGAGDCFYAAFLVFEDLHKANYYASKYISDEI